MSELSFTDLRCRFQTGRSFVVSGEGRNRVYGYRNGVQCALGDLERSKWCELARELIDQEGEQELQKQLLTHLKDHNYSKASGKELEFHALELHMDRIFDNERWLDFLKFNLKYRPEIAAATRLILIMPVMPECCKKAGYITRIRYKENKTYNACPHCGRWTKSVWQRRNIMLDIKNPVQAYEVFKLQWMIEHGVTLPDLVRNLLLMLDEDLDGSTIPTSLQSLFSDWEFGFGFDGAIWPCYQEFLDHDYPIMLKTINT